MIPSLIPSLIPYLVLRAFSSGMCLYYFGLLVGLLYDRTHTKCCWWAR